MFNFLQPLWDRLPYEIQDHIMKLGSKEDRLEKSVKNVTLCKNIRSYAKLKQKWRIGHLQCGFVKCRSEYCSLLSNQHFNFHSRLNCHFHLLFVLNMAFVSMSRK